MKLFKFIPITIIFLVTGSFSFAQSDPISINLLSQSLGVSASDFVSVTVAGNPRISSTNNSDSPRLVLIEFSDVNCGYCIRFHKNTLPHILSSFVETGQIDYVYKDYVSIGGQESEDSALALRCLHSNVGNDIYFDILERFYVVPGRHGLKRLFEIMIIDLVQTQILSEASIDSIRECIESKQFFDAFSIETMEAESIGVVGTPIYVLGVENQTGRVEGIVLPGYLQFEVLEEHVEKMLAVMR